MLRMMRSDIKSEKWKKLFGRWTDESE